MKKKIKKITDQPPATIRLGRNTGKSKKSESLKDASLFSELTLRELSDEEKEKVRIKTKSLLKRLRSKAPQDKRQNELLLRQIIAYLALEFQKVRV